MVLERPTRLARTRRSAGSNIESHTCNLNTVNASANARPLTVSDSSFSTPKTPINHTSCLTSRSGTPALGLTARAPASAASAPTPLV